jgi:hypothetical protein
MKAQWPPCGRISTRMAGLLRTAGSSKMDGGTNGSSAALMIRAGILIRSMTRSALA